MSMKVYDAYKVTTQDVWRLLWRIRDIARENARKAITRHYTDRVRTLDTDTREYRRAVKGATEKEEWHRRLNYVHGLVRDGYKATQLSPYRDMYDLDVSIALYPYERDFYIRAFVDQVSVVGKSLDFLGGLSGLMDYHYQNSSDRPDDICESDWDTRALVWDYIFERNNYCGDHVVVEIVSWEGFYHIDPWMNLYKEWLACPPELPSREQVWAEELGRQEQVTSACGTQDLVTVLSRLYGVITIERSGRNWVLAGMGEERPYRTLNEAANEVLLEHLPESLKGLAKGLMARTQKTG
jgi:hypothetical protein